MKREIVLGAPWVGAVLVVGIMASVLVVGSPRVPEPASQRLRDAGSDAARSPFGSSLPAGLIPPRLDPLLRPTPGHYVVCQDRYLAIDRDHCPDVVLARELREECRRPPVTCERASRRDGGAPERWTLGSLDACEVGDDSKDAIGGVSLEVWKARCALWRRGEYVARADAGVAR